MSWRTTEPEAKEGGPLRGSRRKRRKAAEEAARADLAERAKEALADKQRRRTTDKLEGK